MTYEQKIDILDDFSPRVGNVELELGSSCDHKMSMVGFVYEVGTKILNFLLVSMMFWKLFDFTEKRKIENVIFKLKTIL